MTPISASLDRGHNGYWLDLAHGSQQADRRARKQTAAAGVYRRNGQGKWCTSWFQRNGEGTTGADLFVGVTGRSTIAAKSHYAIARVGCGRPFVTGSGGTRPNTPSNNKAVCLLHTPFLVCRVPAVLCTRHYDTYTRTSLSATSRPRWWHTASTPPETEGAAGRSRDRRPDPLPAAPATPARPSERLRAHLP